MKRNRLLRHLRRYGCILKREGRSHSLWLNPATGASSARTWLQTRFPDAHMADVPGLGKVVSLDEIAFQDHSLTPGRHVGAALPEPENEEQVEERLREIHVELASLDEEAVELAKSIQARFKELMG